MSVFIHYCFKLIFCWIFTHGRVPFFSAQEAKIPLSDFQIEELIKNLDEDGDGEIDFGYVLCLIVVIIYGVASYI